MSERIRRGWELTKASARALDADRELLVFPLVAAIASLLVMATFALPIALTGVLSQAGDHVAGRVAIGVVVWLFYFALSTVTIYCNTALVGAAMLRLEGRDPTLGDGLRVASSRLGSILGYAAVAATVGLLLKAMQRGGRLQHGVASLLGIGWSLATFLVIPVLAATGLGPIDAVKRSAELFRLTWGETLTGAGGIKVFSGLTVVGLILLGVPSGLAAAQTHSLTLMALVIGGFVLAILVTVLIGAALQGVFTAALYRYATTGEGGFGFDPDLLAGVRRPRAA